MPLPPRILQPQHAALTSTVPLGNSAPTTRAVVAEAREVPTAPSLQGISTAAPSVVMDSMPSSGAVADQKVSTQRELLTPAQGWGEETVGSATEDLTPEPSTLSSSMNRGTAVVSAEVVDPLPPRSTKIVPVC